MSVGSATRRAVFLGVFVCMSAVFAQPQQASAPKPEVGRVRATASRGVGGEFTFEYAGAILRAKPNQAITSPTLVRVALMDSPSGAAPGRARTYKVSFIGAVAGTVDLREFVERADGQALTDLPDLSVSIVSQLPEKHGTDLFSAKHPTYLLEGNYRTLMYGFVGLWVAVPAIVLVRRMMRKQAEAPAPVAAPPPTLSELLRPLVEAAADRGLSVAEQGRLELLLLSFWRERLGLASLSPAQAIARIRADPAAGQLLVAVERWLHSRGSGASRPSEDIAALLEPYRAMAGVQVPASAGVLEGSRA